MSAHHHHHDFAGEKLVHAARDALVASGEQWTDMRADVFAALAARENPASAYDIAESVGLEWGGRWTKFIDKPHCQYTGGLTIAQFKAGQTP